MAGSTFIQVPQNITDERQLRRFLDKLVQQLDIAFGNRGDEAFTTVDNFLSGVNSIQELISVIQQEALDYSKIDGSRDYTGIVSYDTEKTFTSRSNEIITIKFAEDTFEPLFTKLTAFNKDFGTTSGTVTEGGTTTNNPTQSAINDLNQTISDPPTQAEVQAISDKVDEILGALRGANINLILN